MFWFITTMAMYVIGVVYIKINIYYTFLKIKNENFWKSILMIH